MRLYDHEVDPPMTAYRNDVRVSSGGVASPALGQRDLLRELSDEEATMEAVAGVNGLLYPPFILAGRIVIHPITN